VPVAAVFFVTRLPLGVLRRGLGCARCILTAPCRPRCLALGINSSVLSKDHPWGTGRIGNSQSEQQ
jgi:hypothetical protein